MNNKGLIIFDFDGTLGDTRKTIVTTMQMTIRELQLPNRSEAACASTIGLPLAGCKSKAKAKAKRPLDESGLFLISINKVVNNFFSYSL